METYLSRRDTGERALLDRRARSAAAALTSVRFERSIHVPEDETCFFVFHAASSTDAALAAERARLSPIRVVEAVSSGEEST